LKKTVPRSQIILNRRISFLALYAFIVLFFILIVGTLRAQTLSFRHEEDSLRKLSKIIYAEKSDSGKQAANSIFSDYLYDLLQKPGINDWSFDSLNDIACLRAPDNSFRVFNWNLPFNNGSFRYYGYLLIPGNKGKANNVIQLVDYSDSIDDPSKQVLPVSHWYGALYYSILKNTWKKQTYYTLLAWDGYSQKTSRKIIDILTFDQKGKPQFGLPVFKTAEGTSTRVIFEYSRSATLLLRYDNQYLVTAQRKDGSPVTKKMGMIVFDRLVPIDPRLKGRFEYYVPSGETYDAYFFNRGFWQLAEDVLVTNPTKKNKPKDLKPVEYNLFPPR
jgi:hypothetical protein